MQNGRKVQNSPTILFLSQLLYNVNLMTLLAGADQIPDRKGYFKAGAAGRQ